MSRAPLAAIEARARVRAGRAGPSENMADLHRFSQVFDLVKRGVIAGQSHLRKGWLSASGLAGQARARHQATASWVRLRKASFWSMTDTWLRTVPSER